jgi:hypothetical protein
MKGLTPLLLIGLGYLWIQADRKKRAAAAAAPTGGEPVSPIVGPQMPYGPTGPIEMPFAGYGNYGRTGVMWKSMGMVPR